jgi:hypothetical protein
VWNPPPKIHAFRVRCQQQISCVPSEIVNASPGRRAAAAGVPDAPISGSRLFFAHSRVAIDAFTCGAHGRRHIDCIRFAVDQLHTCGGACQLGNKDSIDGVVAQC